MYNTDFDKCYGGKRNAKIYERMLIHLGVRVVLCWKICDQVPTKAEPSLAGALSY